MSNSTPKWNFHVFLSFRGKDTRKGFTDHLYGALCKKGIKAFRDDEGLEREVISQKLLQAIEDSLLAIVVISKNYAFSSWCLDELQKILVSRNELGLDVLPIFYGVDPSDVRHQKGSFAEAFTKHEDKFKEDPEKEQQWRDSLTEVANLSGWDSKDWHEAELIEDVVRAIWGKLRSKLPSYKGTLVGIDWRLDAIDSLIGMGLNDVRFIGIWGMGGIGKTTLASIVYEKLLNQFEIYCFLYNVWEVSERCDGQVHLQTELLSLLGIKGMVIENTYQGKNKLLNLFCNKRALLVLDDVSSISQLENLAKSQEWFGVGSRVIITTRNMQLLKSHGVQQIYKVEVLNEKESLQLFSMKAFKRDQPKEGYLELSKSMVKYAGGLPLALEVLGSFLVGRSIPEWEDVLDKVKRVPNDDILKKLKISYDGLDDEEKIIFLDIVCFFKGWNRDKVIQILINCGLHPKVGLKVLIEKSLLNDGIHLDMHDLIEEMGRSIVFQESPNDASERSRLWSMEDIDHILRRNMGSKVIQGMVLHMKKQYKAHWNPEAFSTMCNLRLLIISSNLLLPQGLKCFSSALKVLLWREYPLKTLPPGTQLDKLVDLKMRHSKIKQLWNKIQCLENLKFLDLSHSKYLITTPNFSGLPNLERLTLKGCVNLVELHPSLGQHEKLLVLNLKGCRNLKTLPRKLEMASLKEFILCGCSHVRNLPEFGENMKNLVTLDASGTAITEVPSSIGHLENLKTLSFHGCKGPTILPLFLNDMFQRHSFPKGLILSPSIFSLKSLIELDLSYCNIDDKFIPIDLSGLSSLRELDLRGNKFVNLPAGCISNLSNLRRLYLNFCSRLQSLPQPPPGLELIDAGDCASMETLSDEQLLHLFASIDQHGRYAQRIQYISSNADLRASLSMKSFTTTIPGSKIPSWFENQDYFYLNEEFAGSIIIDVPPCEWLGFVVCIGLNSLFYSTGINQKKFHSPCWHFYFTKASDGESVLLQARFRKIEKEINSPHLWILYGQIREKNGLILSVYYSQLRLKFLADFGRWAGGNKLDQSILMKCGWRVISKAEFEEWGKTMSEIHLPMLIEHEDGENGLCSKAEEQGQSSLSLSESSQTIINECETMSPEASSPCSKDEGKLDDSWMQFITDDAKFWF